MKPRHHSLKSLFAVIPVSLAAVITPASATNRTWVGTTNDWSTTTNWNTTGAPSLVDALTFNDTGTTTTVVKSLTGGAQSLSLTFSGTKSYDFTTGGSANYLIASGIYASSASPLSSTSSGNQTLAYLRLSYSSDGNVTLTNNGSGLVKIDNVMRDATGKTGDIVFTGSGDFQVATLRRNGLDVANGLQKSGAGTLTITSYMTSFTGGGVRGLYGNVAVTGGTLRITSGDQRSLGQPQSANASWLTLNGGTLQASTTNLTIDNANAGITLGASGGTFLVDSGRTLTFAGGSATNGITGGGALTKTGTGTLSLTTKNTYSGTTTIGNGSGILEISHGSALGTSNVAITKSGIAAGMLSLTNDITVANNFTFSSANSLGSIGASAQIQNTSGDNTLSGSLTLNNTGGNGINIESLSGKLTIEGSISSSVTDNTRILSLGGASDGEVSGAIQDTGAYKFALNKVGAGTWTLSGVNTYTYGTSLKEGTLIINGSLANTAVSISGGATLAGSGNGTTTGVIAGAVTTLASTAIISPGNSPGTLTLGTLDITNGGTFNFELGSNSDLLAVTGAVTGGGPLSFNFSDSGGIADSTPYTLFTFGSASGLIYGDLIASSLPSGFALDSSYGTGGWMINSGNLQVQFVPEPTTILLSSLGMLTLLRRRKS